MIRKLFTTGIFVFVMISTTAWAGGDAAAGEASAAGCAGCHGAAGEGMGDNPAIAGLDETEHVKMLQAYKSGEREGVMMQMFAGQLSDEDMANIAAYYAGLGAE